MQGVQALLTSAQSSISALPNVGTYIAALGPASTAYAALSPSLFTSLEGDVTSFASSIQSVRAHSACCAVNVIRLQCKKDLIYERCSAGPSRRCMCGHTTGACT